MQQTYSLLNQINSPEDLRLLPKEQLQPLCDELRAYLLESVSQSSGHLASGLGTVELTVALHYVYHTPFDQLIWDVGHQAYPHKILTGRRDQMHTIRQKDGLHPFPWREESEFDVLSVGHSSTSISAGLGIAVAAERDGHLPVAGLGPGLGFAAPLRHHRRGPAREDRPGHRDALGVVETGPHPHPAVASLRVAFPRERAQMYAVCGVALYGHALSP